VGITAIGPGIENSVALYVDGVYRGSSAPDAMALNNIAGVEVEKGLRELYSAAMRPAA